MYDGKKLFREYSRLEQHEITIKGHGLGLSIVKRIISKLGGEVELAYADETTTVFSFTLPAIPGSARKLEWI